MADSVARSSALRPTVAVDYICQDNVNVHLDQRVLLNCSVGELETNHNECHRRWHMFVELFMHKITARTNPASHAFAKTLLDQKSTYLVDPRTIICGLKMYLLEKHEEK